MKVSKLVLMFIFGCMCFTSYSQSNNSELPTSINEDGTAPHSSAILDVQSDSKGMLVPRMTSVQRTGIATPATGLLVYDTDSNSFWYYDSSGWADLSSTSGADDDWNVLSNGIQTDSFVAINTSSIDLNSNLYVFRPLGDFGAGKAALFAYRSGFSSTPDSGGIHHGTLGIDAAVKAFSNWGNAYTAAVAGHSYLDYTNSAAVLGGDRTGDNFGALGFRDSTQLWAGYFDGDVRFRPASNYTPELYLDIVREYVNQGEFGQWHELYVLPRSRNTNAPDYDFYYLGNSNNHFDGAYLNAINPANSLFLNGTTIVSGANELGVGTSLPGMKLHVKQDIANRGIRTEHQSTSDYWDTGIGITTKNYKFYYNGTSKADIASIDGAYIETSDASLKTDVDFIPTVLSKVLQLKPASYYYKDSKSQASAKSIGFLAQEVEEVFPEIVRQKDDGTKGLAYSNFAVLAIKAIQEQQEMINQLKDEIDKLKSDK